MSATPDPKALVAEARTLVKYLHNTPWARTMKGLADLVEEQERRLAERDVPGDVAELAALRKRVQSFEAVYRDLAAEEIVLRMQAHDQPGVLSADPLGVIRSVVDRLYVPMFGRERIREDVV
jgi:hypothetical protein